jgi:predicted acetyltransferase
MTDQPDDLQLIEPTADFKDDYLAMVAELAAIHAMDFAALYERIKDFDTYLRHIQNDARGVDMAPGRVPQTIFWLLRAGHGGQRIVGEIRIRHYLNESLEHYGGHIGYAIRPGEWRQGYGTRQLALALPKARDLGLMRVMLTCDVDNFASARIIEANGGKLASQGISRVTGKMISRYWIEL